MSFQETNKKNEIMSLYVFTVRRARLDKKSKYVGLIPKLYTDNYIDNKVDIKSIPCRQKKSNKEQFKCLLEEENNLLHKSEYIDKNDISNIIKLNMELFDKDEWTQPNFNKFLEHLYRGHGNMEYGIYFGTIKATSYLDFLEQIKRTFVYGDQRIIYYIEISELLNHIDNMKETKSFNTDLLYFNQNWSYGKYDYNSFIYKKDYREDFINHINKYNNKQLKNCEIICHIPLPTEIFKFTFGQMGGNTKHKTKSKVKSKSKKNKVKSKSKKSKVKSKVKSKSKVKNDKIKK